MANEGWQKELGDVVASRMIEVGRDPATEIEKVSPGAVAEAEKGMEDVTNVDEINDIKLDRSIAAAERYNKTGNLSMIIRGEIHDLTDEELKKMDEIEKAEGGIYKLGPKEVAQQLEFFQLKVTVFKRVTGESVRKDTPKKEVEVAHGALPSQARERLVSLESWVNQRPRRKKFDFPKSHG